MIYEYDEDQDDIERWELEREFAIEREIDEEIEGRREAAPDLTRFPFSLMPTVENFDKD